MLFLNGFQLHSRWVPLIKELFSALLIREYGEITLQPLAIALIKRVLHFLFNLKLYKCRALKTTFTF